MTPTSVMTMLMTPAKIGRSMKKCGKFIAKLLAPEPRSFCGWRLGGVRFRGRGAGRCQLGHRRYLHTGLQQLQAGGDNFLSVLKSAFHDSFTFEKRAGFKSTALNCVIGFHDEREFESLL